MVSFFFLFLSDLNKKMRFLEIGLFISDNAVKLKYSVKLYLSPITLKRCILKNKNSLYVFHMYFFTQFDCQSSGRHIE